MALKLEHRSLTPSILEEEASKYSAFREIAGFPRVFWFGWHDDFKVMAFELLGPSLEDLFAFCEHRFSLKTTLMIIDQSLLRLEQMHPAGIVHRDVKPRNFLIGGGVHSHLIHATDFGLAEQHFLHQHNHEGPRCASLAGHEGRCK